MNISFGSFAPGRKDLNGGETPLGCPGVSNHTLADGKEPNEYTIAHKKYTQRTKYLFTCGRFVELAWLVQYNHITTSTTYKTISICQSVLPIGDAFHPTIRPADIWSRKRIQSTALRTQRIYARENRLEAVLPTTTNE